MIRRFLRPKSPPFDAEHATAALLRPRYARLRLDRFPPGVDGVHIDVALGPAMEKSARLFVGSLVQENVATLLGQTLTAASDTVLPLFREQIREHHSAAVKESRETKSAERMQLFQLAVLKLLFQNVDAELAQVRERVERELDQRAGQPGGRGLALHREAAMLSRASSHIRFRVARRVVGALNQLERGGLRNLRESILGQAWPVAEVMTMNPLLQLDGLGTLGDFGADYPVVLHDLDVTKQVSACLTTTLSHWLPEAVAVGSLGDPRQPTRKQSRQPTENLGKGQLALRPWVADLLAKNELSNGLSSWFDEPENVRHLLGGGTGAEALATTSRRRGIFSRQRHLARQFEALLRRAGLHQKAVAAYAMADVYPTLGLTDAESLVFDYLSGAGGRRHLQRRLEALNQDVDILQVMRRIDKRYKAFRRSQRDNPQGLAIRLAVDFCRLRRDLKLASQAYDALARIRLLTDPESLDLSRSNSTLQLFCQQPQVAEYRGVLTGHTILRVDLRGSHALVSALTRRGLKPDGFFTRYLYTPLTETLALFGGQKVTIEAGTLVLSTLEYAEGRFDQLCVARACALAIQLLEAGEALNAETERIGLEPLEYSFAIVYANTAPTYLYDQSRRVLVSAANTQARRMASCHPTLRHRFKLPGGANLCVASPVPGPDDPASQAELVRYNVNGIELDPAAFNQLNAELSLRKVKVHIPGARGASKLYVGRCPDVHGGSHLIVVREQSVKLWMGRQLLDSPGEGRTFFELVTDRDLLQQLLTRLGENGPADPATVRAPRL